MKNYVDVKNDGKFYSHLDFAKRDCSDYITNCYMSDINMMRFYFMTNSPDIITFAMKTNGIIYDYE